MGYVNQAIEELIGAFGVKAPVHSDPIFEALNAGKTQEFLTIIANYFGLPVVIDLSTVDFAVDPRSSVVGERFESTAIVCAARPGQAAQCITAQVLIPDSMPFYGTSGLENLHLHIKVSDNCQKYPKTFAAVMAHEFAHIVLYSIKHSQRHNEFYTDLTAMVLGFSEIFRQGRKTVEAKESSVQTITTTTTYGYLSDELFNFAFDKIKNTFIELRKEDKELKEKILNRIVSFNRLVTDYEQKRQLLGNILENFDNTSKKVEKTDAPEIVKMHQMYFLESLTDKGKHHLAKLAQISESATKILDATSLYSKQRLNLLLSLLHRIESELSELQKDSNYLEHNISLLERNATFFERQRIKQQLQRLKKEGL